MLFEQATKTPKAIDNVGRRLGDDIAGFLKPETTVYVASSGFSLSAFEHLSRIFRDKGVMKDRQQLEKEMLKCQNSNT